MQEKLDAAALITLSDADTHASHSVIQESLLIFEANSLSEQLP